MSQSQRRSRLYIALNKLKVGGAQCRAATAPARRSRYFSNQRFYPQRARREPRRPGGFIHGGSANFPQLGGEPNDGWWVVCGVSGPLCWRSVRVFHRFAVGSRWPFGYVRLGA
ncbi:hypothetical protein AOLI_G00312760 [Acnodon oligacanthus]